MSEKKKKILLSCVAGVLVAGVALSSVVSILTMKTVGKLNDTVSSYVNSGDDVAQEDNVKIAGQYEIKSTLSISDAYKSGDTSKLTDKEKETLDMASAVLKEIIKDGMTDYDKELAVYNWMTTKLQHDNGLLTVIPTTQADCDNPYGVLKYHNAVCVGYATTFRLFMQMMNIECMVVHNTERYHSWDLVKLDGEWYHTDIYSDAATGNYANFNMNDAMCTATYHEWNTDFFPEATGLKYNYGYRNKIMVDDVYQIAGEVKKALENKKGDLFIGFKSGITEEQAQMAQTLLNDISNYLSNSGDYSSLSMNWSFVPLENGQFMLCVYITGYPQKEDTQLSDDVLQKIQKAVDEAFGIRG